MYKYTLRPIAPCALLLGILIAAGTTQADPPGGGGGPPVYVEHFGTCSGEAQSFGACNYSLTVHVEFAGAPQTYYFFELSIVADRDPRDVNANAWGEPYDYAGPLLTGVANADGMGWVNFDFVVGQSLGLPVPVDGWGWRVDAYYMSEGGNPVCTAATGYVSKPSN